MTTSIQTLVAEGNAEKALQELFLLAQKKGRIKDVINLQNQLNQLQRKEQLNLLSNEQVTVLSSRLNDAILGLADDLERTETSMAQVLPNARKTGKGLLYFLASTGALTILIVFLALNFGDEVEVPAEQDFIASPVKVASPKIANRGQTLDDLSAWVKQAEKETPHLFPKEAAKNRFKKGKKEGKWIEYFDENWQRIKNEGQASYYRLIEYVDGKPNGLVRDFFQSGKLQWIGELADVSPDKQEGPGLWYNEKGEPVIIRHHVNGKWDGISYHYPINGSFPMVEHFNRGKLDSIFVFNSDFSKLVFKEAIAYGRKSKPTKSTLYWQTLYDDFSTNTGQWQLLNTETGGIWMEDSKYFYENKVDGKALIGFRNRYFYLPEHKDFQIEVDAYWFGGVTNMGYGLIWGGKDINNHHQLLIAANGSVGIFEKAGGKLFGQWLPNNAVKQKSSNLLVIEKTGNTISFFINNQKVHSMPYKTFHGQLLGFHVVGQQKVAFDDLKVFVKG